MPDTELYLAYDAAILILVTDQIPGPNIRCKLEFVDSITHQTNEDLCPTKISGFTVYYVSIILWKKTSFQDLKIVHKMSKQKH